MSRRIPRGWKIERCGQDTPLNLLSIKAPNGYTAIVSKHDRNPENVLYMLADTLLDDEHSVQLIASDGDEATPMRSVPWQFFIDMDSYLRQVESFGTDAGKGVVTGIRLIENRWLKQDEPVPVKEEALHHIVGPIMKLATFYARAYYTWHARTPNGNGDQSDAYRKQETSRKQLYQAICRVILQPPPIPKEPQTPVQSIAPKTDSSEDVLMYEALTEYLKESDGITVSIPSELVAALQARLKGQS